MRVISSARMARSMMSGVASSESCGVVSDLPPKTCAGRPPHLANVEERDGAATAHHDLRVVLVEGALAVADCARSGAACPRRAEDGRTGGQILDDDAVVRVLGRAGLVAFLNLLLALGRLEQRLVEQVVGLYAALSNSREHLSQDFSSAPRPCHRRRPSWRSPCS